MIRVTILLCLLGAVFSYSNQLDSHWKLFKQVHGKNYETPELEAKHRKAFDENVARVVKHNVEADLGLKSYRLKVNKFADLTNEEFRKFYNGLKYDKNRVSRANEVHKAPDSIRSLPKEVDWRKKGLVLPIKNQAQCGSCWAFAAVAAIEGQNAKATGKLLSLSEQNLVDCSGPEGNMGCNGGLPDQAYDYVIKNGGIDSEDSYPYEGQDDSCRYKAPSAATIKGYTDVDQGSEQALQSASATVGPIAVGIDASNFSFQLYSGGVYDEESCSTSVLDHGVTVVGYGSDNGQDYWLVKNSWGESWGESGYIKMSRNKDNQCGISTMASYPKV